VTKALITLVLACILVPPLAQARDQRPAMQVVIDESDGMSVPVNGRTLFRRAIDAARKANESRPAPARGDLSWRVVGGGRPGDDAACETTRSIAPAGISAGVILQSVARETPRGPRPLVAAMEASQADLPHDRQRATVFITSGGDNCGRNVCFAASDLRKSDGLGLVRVILVGTDPKAEGQLACLGSLVKVTDPEKLTGAIVEAIEALDHPAEVTVTANEAGREASGRVEFYTHEDDKPFATGKTGEPIALLAGTYHVHVMRTGGRGEDLKDGWRRNVEIVADAHLTVRVPMGQEQAEITASVKLNGAPAPGGTRIAIFHVGETEGAMAEGFPDETIHVPAGKYDVRALIPGGPIDTIQVWKPEVKVLPGQKVAVDLVAIQKRGELSVEVVAGKEKVTDVSVMLLPPGSRDQSDMTFAPGEAITVPVGKYTLLARLQTPGGNINAYKDGVVVAADQLTAARVDTGPIGHLTIEVTGRKPEDGLVISLMRADDDNVLGLVEPFSQFDLPVGAYDLRVEDHSKGLPQIYWQHGVKVPGGEKTVALVKPKSGR
jgi:hypothetical protein